MLELRSIRKTFHPGASNETRALTGVDLTLAEGSFITVIGGNGSGKSTLLNAIAGAIPVDSGTIHIDGNDITRHPEHRRASYIGRVFQNPFQGTAPDMTVEENIALAARRGLPRRLQPALSGALRKEIEERVAGIGVGLEKRLDTLIGALSGGQRQAITLLMATWLKPRLLLLDEHTAALDPKSADAVIRLTDLIVSSQKITTLMVTHSMQQAAVLGDRLVMMHRGAIEYDCSGAEKQRVRPRDLLQRFDQIRRQELLDETAAEILRRSYV